MIDSQWVWLQRVQQHTKKNLLPHNKTQSILNSLIIKGRFKAESFLDKLSKRGLLLSCIQLIWKNSNKYPYSSMVQRAGKRNDILFNLVRSHVSLAEWLRRWPRDLNDAGSNLKGGTSFFFFFCLFVCLFGFFFTDFGTRTM